MPQKNTVKQGFFCNSKPLALTQSQLTASRLLAEQSLGLAQQLVKSAPGQGERALKDAGTDPQALQRELSTILSLRDEKLRSASLTLLLEKNLAPLTKARTSAGLKKPDIYAVGDLQSKWSRGLASNDSGGEAHEILRGSGGPPPKSALLTNIKPLSPVWAPTAQVLNARGYSFSSPDESSAAATLLSGTVFLPPVPAAPRLTTQTFSGPYSFYSENTPESRVGLNALLVFNSTVVAGSSSRTAFLAQTLRVPAGVRRVQVLAELQAQGRVGAIVAGYGFTDSTVHLQIRRQGSGPETRVALWRYIFPFIGYANDEKSWSGKLGCEFLRPDPTIAEELQIVVTLEVTTGGGGLPLGISNKTELTVPRLEAALFRD